MARLSSSSQTVVVPSTTSRSITCITGSRAAPSVLSTPYHSSYTPHGQFTSARITVSSSGVGGMASPTKSMSSGSMSMDPNSCREVLTVNVNQINQDLIRQVSSVLSHHDIHNLLQPATSSNLQPTSSTHHMVSALFTLPKSYFAFQMTKFSKFVFKVQLYSVVQAIAMKKSYSFPFNLVGLNKNKLLFFKL